MRLKSLFLVSVMVVCLFPAMVYAASTSYSQAGADAGTVMKGKVFTVAVAGLSGTGTVTLILPTGFSASEDTTKAFASETTTVSWTTVVANEKVSSQTISAIISTTGTPTTVVTSSFDVVLPPSLSVSTSSVPDAVVAGSSFSFSMNIQNNGETTAKFGTIAVSPSYFSKSSGCSPSSVPAGQSAALSCSVEASSSAPAGSRTVSILVAPSNANSVTKSISITVNAAPGGGSGDDDPSSGPSFGGDFTPPGLEKKNVTHKPGPPGLMNNLKLQAALGKVLAKGELNQNAIENLLRLSAMISGESDIARSITVEGANSEVKTRVNYRGKNTIRNYVVYEKIPKSFAESTDNITITAPGATIEVVEKDPEYAIVFDTVTPNQELTITYIVNDAVSTAAVDSFSTELYAEEFVGVEDCPQVVTPAINPATGECVEYPTPCDVPQGWDVVDSCPVVDSTGEPEPTGESQWMIYAIVLILLVAGGYYLYKTGKLQSIFKKKNTTDEFFSQYNV